jgi:hypothetical protein
LHEWATSKGKEKKPPEAIHYWNSSLSNEIEVEVDLYIQHLFLKHKDDSSYTMPCLDYDSNNFARKGTTVLFGGDHGNKHCPISCKLNLSPPEERKTRKELSKDAFNLMNFTVMPTIKQQLLELQEQSLITVYHTKNMRRCFRSYMVPSSILPGTIAFLLKTNNDNNNIPCMTFAHRELPNPSFGWIDIVDPVFQDVPFFELGAKVTVTSFNELFIGDLAFLAMLVGMNNSSGSHCLMCVRKSSDFNCNHNQLIRRTKASLVHSLEQYMLLANNPNRKAPANFNGVNSKGLWDIDPQRIVIPILHCPMGLVDKILESLKHWINLDVEDFKDDETEGTRSVYLLCKVQHKSAIDAHEQARNLEQACNLVIANPTSQQAKDMERTTNKARIAAKEEETKAKELYTEFMQRHNAKKNSLNQKFEIVYRANGVK